MAISRGSVEAVNLLWYYVTIPTYGNPEGRMMGMTDRRGLSAVKRKMPCLDDTDDG
jgi:hypothetical protein